MTGHRRLDLEVLHQSLRDALRHGARAVHLLWYVPHLVDMLFPPEQHPDLTGNKRAIETQLLIQRGIEAIGGDKGHALAIVLGLAPATFEITLTDRREKAADYLGIQAITWVKRKHEARALHGLALEIYQLHRNPTPEPETT
jgi:hypothetical protein